MNQIQQSLADICQTCRFDEKVLLAPSIRVGNQWIEAIARAGQPVVNMRAMTFKAFALQHASEDMAAHDCRLLRPLRAECLTAELFERFATRGNGYLFSLKPSPGLCQSIYRMIQDLRLAGITPQEIRCETPTKTDEVQQLLAVWPQLLAEHHLTDYAQALTWAAKSLRDAPKALPESFKVLLPADLQLTVLEQQVWRAVPDKQRIVLPVDDGEASAPTIFLRGQTTIRRAKGEINEVRSVLRDCIEKSIPLDNVELLCSDSKTYIPLIFETLHAVLPDAQDLPLTVAEGIPMIYARPTRALLAWFAWVREGYPQSGLMRMISDGLLTLPEDMAAQTMANVLRDCPIGFSRERYKPAIENRIQNVAHRLQDKEHDEEQRQRLNQRLTTLAHLRTLVEELLNLSAQLQKDGEAALDAVRQFCDVHAKSIDQLDHYASQKINDLVAELKASINNATGHTTIADWFTALLRETQIAGSAPKPGCLHVASMLQGGHSARPHTYILGLDDSRFPGAGLQDPLLLDAEREQVSTRVPTAATRQEEKLKQFRQLLARLRGVLVLSHSCLDIVDDREAFPSVVLLNAFRSLANLPTGDLSDFNEYAGEPVTFAPATPARSLTLDEWWLRRLCQDTPVDNAFAVLTTQYPHLKQGHIAMAHRADAQFNEYDGYVPEAGEDGDLTAAEARPVSASQLETLGKCPFQYFLRYVLKVVPPDDVDIDPTIWLDAKDRGTLLHDVFRDYMRDLNARALLPDVDRDTGPIRAILDRHVELWKKQSAPPSESVFRREYFELRETVNRFVRSEAEFCRTGERHPLYFEAALGLPSDGDGTPLDTPEPVKVNLGNGVAIKARGRIDRIDRLGPDGAFTYEVWDYKSGGTSLYDQSDPFAKGTKVQSILYQLMVEDVLRNQVDKHACVSRFGYFFPGARGMGERLAYDARALEPGIKVLRHLCELVRRGAFIHNTSKEDGGGKYCDHAPLDELEAQGVDMKLSNEENAMLKPLREVRNHG